MDMIFQEGILFR